MEGEMVDLEALYRGLGWPSRPKDPVARERFNDILRLAETLLDKGPLAGLPEKGRIRILDIMAGSGIASVAFAKALSLRGASVELLVTDLREEELGLALEWARVAGLEEHARVRYARADASRLPELGEQEFDLVICWGSSMPHLDVYKAVLLLSGVREVQAADGALIIQQKDLLPWILVNNSFRHIMVEGGLLTIYREYDARRGVQKRLVYKLPGLEYLGVAESRLWELSQIVSLSWIFYENVEVLDYIERGYPSKVIVAQKPRRIATPWKDLLRGIPLETWLVSRN